MTNKVFILGETLRMNRWLLVLMSALFGFEMGTMGAADGLSFEKDIRPILKAHCFDCHGEGDVLKGGLDLRLRRFMERGGKQGPALVPGDPEKSLVFRMVRDGTMPKRDRKLEPKEVERLKLWIEQGAKTSRTEPEELDEGFTITDEERAHWAFQPIRRPPVPRSETGPGAKSAAVSNPIDAFVAAKHKEKGLSFSEEAPKRSLIKRAYLALWGLMPTPSEVDAFSVEEQAYEGMLERLMSSTRYGERWARHWLDVAGYADSDGYTNDDSPRPYSYKYRDYVIQAMNRDLPYDRFILEQLAGDELALTKHKDLSAAVHDPVARDWLIATGYLRNGADGTASGGIDQEAARNQVVADTIKIVSTSLLGLSVGCAQCHDHRYDPISHVDYHRIRAVFEPAYDWKNWRTPPQRRLSLYTTEQRAKASAVEAEASKLAQEKETKQKEFIDAALKKHLEKFELPLRESLLIAVKTASDKRTPEQKRLLADHPSVNIHPGVLYQYDPKAADELKAMDSKINEVRAKKPVEDFLSVLTEAESSGAATLPVTYRFHRGDPKQPKEAVGPGIPIVLAGDGGRTDLPLPEENPPTSRRRLAFAKWLTSKRNPLLARVIVNRVWMHHFGQGLVTTAGDFGIQGERPTHPELLDWLASVFMAAKDDRIEKLGLGWSLKGLHRLIMTSKTYRQSSYRDPARDEIDPENRYLWRRSVTRLDAEALRDSTLMVSGTFSDRMFGPSVPVREDAVGQIVVGVDKKEGDNKMPVDVPLGEEEFRRSIYVEVRRSKPLAFLNTFDAPIMEVNCERRPSSTVAPQALMLMNSEFALQQAKMFANRLHREAGIFPEAQVERAWRLIYGRPPSKLEFDDALVYLRRQKDSLVPVIEQKSGDTKGRELLRYLASDPERQALQHLCQVLLSSNEFLYID